MVIDHPFTRIEDLKMPNSILGLGRISIVLQAIRIARKEVGDFLPISSHVVGEFFNGVRTEDWKPADHLTVE